MSQNDIISATKVIQSRP